MTSRLKERVNRRASSKRLRSPPGQRLDRHMNRFFAEQKIFQVTDNVARSAVNRDLVTGHGKVVAYRFLRVQGFAVLIEVGDFEARVPDSDSARLWRQLTEQYSWIRVDLPQPLGPRIPIFSPRRILQLRSLIIGYGRPRLKPRFSASITILPEASARCAVSLAAATTLTPLSAFERASFPMPARGPRYGCAAP